MTAFPRPRFDDYDIIASEVMTMTAIHGQTMKTQDRIADLLRSSFASPSLSPGATPLAPPQDGVSDPRQVAPGLPGEEFRKEIA